jgi:hypothetical protein
MVEHLENSAPLIFDEIQRWRYLLWEEWIEYQQGRKCPKKVPIP